VAHRRQLGGADSRPGRLAGAQAWPGMPLHLQIPLPVAAHLTATVAVNRDEEAQAQIDQPARYPIRRAVAEGAWASVRGIMGSVARAASADRGWSIHGIHRASVCVSNEVDSGAVSLPLAVTNMEQRRRRLPRFHLHRPRWPVLPSGALFVCFECAQPYARRRWPPPDRFRSAHGAESMIYRPS